jgi:hypothetical protein
LWSSDVRRIFLVAIVVLATVTAALAQAPQSSPPQTPPAAPGSASSPSPTTTVPPPAPGTTPGRTFTAPVGLLFNTVRPERVADFEKVIAFLQSALEKSSDANDRAQAQGWRVFKAAEPGPGGTVLYVFVLDPTVPGADYGLGRILAEAYPDTTQLQEIWKLYSGAVTSGGTLLNLTPVKPGTTPTLTTAPAATPPAERPLPPDADPNRR